MRPFEIKQAKDRELLENFLETTTVPNMKEFIELLNKATCHVVITLGKRLENKRFQIHLRSVALPRIIYSSYNGDPFVDIGKSNELSLNLTLIEEIFISQREKDTCYIKYDGGLQYRIHVSYNN